MQHSSSKLLPDPNQNEYSYENDQFQSPSDDSYASKVQKLFAINYQSSTYQNIELSTTQMRLMMKDLSKKLDQKIHKYYGLMGEKHSNFQEDLQTYKQKLKKQVQSHKKLIESQLTQIKEIQQIDVEMASSKRVEKQAERLRQYFETKKAMIEADKEARFSKGQMNKAGQYLARDLDSEKHYFRLNKIKQDLEYAMLKESNLKKITEELQKKFQQLQQKYQKINEIYNQRIVQAQSSKLLIEDNKSFYTQFQTKKQYIQLKEEIKKKTEILKYNVQNTVMKIVSDLQKMKNIQKQHADKIASCEEKIANISKEINQSTKNPDLNAKFQLNLSIKNIDILLKNKKEKSEEMLKNFSHVSQNLQSDFKPTIEMTDSSILLKPNFKIKHYLTKSRTKMDSTKDSRINKSMDFGKRLQKSNGLKDIISSIPNIVRESNKNVLKWKPRKKTDVSKKLMPIISREQIINQNPEQQIMED